MARQADIPFKREFAALLDAEVEGAESRPHPNPAHRRAGFKQYWMEITGPIESVDERSRDVKLSAVSDNVDEDEYVDAMNKIDDDAQSRGLTFAGESAALTDGGKGTSGRRGKNAGKPQKTPTPLSKEEEEQKKLATGKKQFLKSIQVLKADFMKEKTEWVKLNKKLPHPDVASCVASPLSKSFRAWETKFDTAIQKLMDIDVAAQGSSSGHLPGGVHYKAFTSVKNTFYDVWLEEFGPKDKANKALSMVKV